jgi:succinate dehydrogenase / fumarate reductase membrane anchor subunit
MSLNNKRFNSDFHNGIPHWKFQRISAIINMPLIVWFVYSLATFSDYSYFSVTEWVKSPINCILIISMFASIFYHSSLGIQVVIEDYISEIKSRAFLLNFSKLIIFFLFIVSFGSVINIYIK